MAAFAGANPVPSIADLSTTVALAASRADYAVRHRAEKVLAVLAGEMNSANRQAWADALWSAATMNDRGPEVRAGMERLMMGVEALDAPARLVVMRSVYTLYPGEYTAFATQMLTLAQDPRTLAMAGHYLLAADREKYAPAVKRALETRGAEWPGDARLEWLAHRATISALAETTLKRPPLADLLAAPLRPGLPVVYSIQRVDRRQPGLAIVRQPDGRFRRNPDGTLFAVGQLAMARTNMPGTITFGNTPQGIFTVRGSGIARNQWIGPTPYLYSKVPFEATVPQFLHDPAASGDWTEDVYTQLLPASWQGYFPMREAWLAGKAGRSEMLMHGTTISPDHYRSETYWPFTPSAGCLCTLEFWSPEDGRLLHSDQLALLRAFLDGTDGNGYLVVVEIDANLRPVTIGDIIEDVLAAEAR
jgi:hypothetical protein